MKYARAMSAEEGGGLLCICTCNAATHLVIQFEGQLTSPQEAAFTCDGCGASHWFVMTPND